MPEEIVAWLRARGWNVPVRIGLVVLVVFLICLFFSDAPAVAQSLGNVVGGALGAIAAIIVVQVTFQNQAKAEEKRRDEELASIRTALRTEIDHFAAACWHEFEAWQAVRHEG